MLDAMHIGVCSPPARKYYANSSSCTNIADDIARPMSSLASDAAISGAKAAQTQQAYGNSEGGGHYGPSVLKPEKYESVDTPTPPPEGNSTAVSSNNGSSGNGQTQNGRRRCGIFHPHSELRRTCGHSVAA